MQTHSFILGFLGLGGPEIVILLIIIAIPAFIIWLVKMVKKSKK